jgi:hypothetical protein
MSSSWRRHETHVVLALPPWNRSRKPSGSSGCEVYRQGIPARLNPASAPVPWVRWPTRPRYVSSSHQAREADARDVGLPDVGTRRVPGCAAARSPHWPASASSTTPSSSAAPWPESEHPCSRHRPRPAARRRRTGPHCSISPKQPTEPARSSAHDVAADGPGRRAPRSLGLDSITGGPALVRNGRMDLLAPTPRSGHARLALRTSHRPGPQLRRYTFLDEGLLPVLPQLGTPQPTPASQSCVPKQAATPTTPSCTTSSESSLPSATNPTPLVRSRRPTPRSWSQDLPPHRRRRPRSRYESVDMLSEPD